MRARHHAASALEAIYCVTHAALRVARSDSIHGSPGQGAELDAMGRRAGGGDAIIQPRGSEGTQGFPHDGPRTSRSRSQPAYNRCLYLYWLNTLVAWTPVPGVQRCWPIMRRTSGVRRVALKLHLPLSPEKHSIWPSIRVPEIHAFMRATGARMRESRVLKTGSPARGSWVQIPPSPP